MPTSGEVRINGTQVFINDVSVSLRAMPPVVVKRKDMNAPAVKPAPRLPAKVRPKPGVAKHGKPGAPVGGAGSSRKRAALAKYWATHKAEYNKWAHDNGKDHTDCGVFIGKVMRDSGSDPNYPTGWTGAQWDMSMTRETAGRWDRSVTAGWSQGTFFSASPTSGRAGTSTDTPACTPAPTPAQIQSARATM